MWYNYYMFKKTISNSKRGFTLVELMVVVAIIGILTSIAVMSGSSARKLARDNQRVSDIQLLQLKLEAYRDQNGVYPITLQKLVDSGFLTAIPKDPTGTPYDKYAGLTISGNTCVNYHLGVLLDANSNSLQKAKHLAPETACAGEDFDASNESNGGPTNNRWYDVVSPNAF